MLKGKDMNKMISEYNTGPKAVLHFIKLGIDSDNTIVWEAELDKHTPNDKRQTHFMH